MWTPLETYQVNSFIKSSNEDDTYDRMRREYEPIHFGLIDEPIQSMEVVRGGSKMRGGVEAEVQDCIDTLKKAHKLWNEYNAIKNQRDKKFNERFERFAIAEPNDIYVVFYEDCKNREWSILSSWKDTYHEVWDRLKIKLSDAIERIKGMQPLPPPPPKPLFTVDPKIKQEINKRVSLLVPIIDEDTAPYKIVVEQKALKSDLAQYYAILASQKIMEKMGGNKPPFININSNLSLYMSLCQYDPWDKWYNFLKENAQIGEWDRIERNFPTAYWDFSNDPDFEYADQKKYSMNIVYYNSHESGY